MNANRLTTACILIIAILICLGTAAQAHDTWVTVTPYNTAENTKVDYKVFNSHSFPALEKDLLAPERLEEMFFITPAAKRLPKNASFSESGTVLGVAVPVNGFATKTPDGYQQGKNKREVSSSILCRKSMKFAKAVFTVGQAGGQAATTPVGHAMEIIPLKDPATLSTGDTLPVKVLKAGKPIRTYVFGTYEGFSHESNTFGYTTRTDKEGIARVKLIHDGPWLLIAKHEEPYPDTAECDLQRWAATLTFKIE